jgi:hypothetical protein
MICQPSAFNIRRISSLDGIYTHQYTPSQGIENPRRLRGSMIDKPLQHPKFNLLVARGSEKGA